MSGLYRDYVMSADSFTALADIAYRHTGIVLGENKRDLVYSRITKRLRALGIAEFDDYLTLISDSESAEFKEFINAITTNLTAFFREAHHFDFMSRVFLPEMVAKKANKIRIWSAACSTGEEAYSIAIKLLQSPDMAHRDVKVLATDIDSAVLAKARQGQYRRDALKEVTDTDVLKYAHAVADQPDDVCMDPRLKKLIQFNRLNLLGNWPMQGKFDLVFCRNVVIYFDKATQYKLFNKIADHLQPHGYLCIGHSENLHGLTDRFELLGKTVYRKIA